MHPETDVRQTETSVSNEALPVAFEHTYAQLPPALFARVRPTPVSAPSLIRLNDELALSLGLDPATLRTASGIAMLAGSYVPPQAEPLAMAYAGHQFGVWVPQLGDGRAILLGERVDNSGIRHDIQLKGAGRTPFSRGGDGRAWIGPVLREYLLSEAMAALGVPTTRALAAVASGDTVMRERALPGAVLTRVARSHVRVGTFQYFTARRDRDALEALLAHVIERLYPAALESASPAFALLQAVVDRQAALVAQWQSLGFIHGVMNTDNTAVSGETIDYGPCAFMDGYNPDKVFSSIDQMGRYAYRNQPGILQWNLANFAQCLLPFIDDDEQRALELAQGAISGYAARYRTHWLERMRAKLGLLALHEPSSPASGETGEEDRPAADDRQLIDELLAIMAERQADFTESFRVLSESIPAEGTADREAANALPTPNQAADTPGASTWQTLHDGDGKFHSWYERWQQRLARDPQKPGPLRARLLAVNPAIIPRNHRVEAVIDAAVRNNDLAPFHEFVEVLRKPFSPEARHAAYRSPPSPDEEVRQTFCGT